MTACSICGSESHTLALSACNTHGRHILDSSERFDYYRCAQCDNVFVANIVADHHFQEKYYPQGYYDGSGKTSFFTKCAELYYGRGVRIRERMIRKYAEPGAEKLSILDVGCGSGSFLELLNGGHYDKYGVDVNPEAIRLCRSKGLTVFDGDIREEDFGGKTFDVITLWHVLEHVSNPVGFMKRLGAIKKSNGIIVVSVPNTDSLGFRAGKEWWFHTDAPRHLFLPNAASMAKLVDSAGMQIVDTIHPKFEFPLDLFWSVRKSPLLLAVYPLYPLFKLFSRETLVFIVK